VAGQPTEDESGAMVLAMICDAVAKSPKAGQQFFDSLPDGERQEIATAWRKGKDLQKKRGK
jgi:hypothetical protein